MDALPGPISWTSLRTGHHGTQYFAIILIAISAYKYYAIARNDLMSDLPQASPPCIRSGLSKPCTFGASPGFDGLSPNRWGASEAGSQSGESAPYTAYQHRAGICRLAQAVQEVRLP